MVGNSQSEPSNVPVIPGYVDLHEIGSGGYSSVYRAFQERFARTVAVKIITAELSEEALRRFRREQATTGQLDGHPHIIRVYDAGFTAADKPYLTMEYLEEGSLADKVRRSGPLEATDVLAIGVQLACALNAAHERGIVHRDVKPQNVLISPFVGPVLADFGIAGFDDARLSTVTTEAFSLLHVAPEVLEGDRPTPAADLYSLSSTMYELLSGRAAYADTEDMGLLALMRRVRTEGIPPIARPDIPPALETAVIGLMAREPHDRPAVSGLEMAEQLQEVQRAVGFAPTPLVEFSAPASTAASGTAATTGAVNTSPPPDPTPDEASGASATATHTVRPRKRRPPSEPTKEGSRRKFIVGLAVMISLAVIAAGVVGWKLLDEPDSETQSPSAAAARKSESDADGSTSTTTNSTVPESTTTPTTAVPDQAVPPPTTAAPAPSTTAPQPAPAAMPPCPRSAMTTVPAHEEGEAGIPPTKIDAWPRQDDPGAVSVVWDDPNEKRSSIAVLMMCDLPMANDQPVVRVVRPGGVPLVRVGDLDLSHNYCFSVGVFQPDNTIDLFSGVDGKHFLCLDGTAR